jgi:hypothetical protein
MERVLQPNSARIWMKTLILWPILILLWACATPLGNQHQKEMGKEILPTQEEKWGLKIIAVRLTAGGYMLDLRYKVTDPEKAAPLLDQKIKPFLVDQETGIKLYVPNMPKAGFLKHRVDNPDVEKTYFILFGNSRGLVRHGRLVTVSLGDFRKENLAVE